MADWMPLYFDDTKTPPVTLDTFVPELEFDRESKIIMDLLFRFNNYTDERDKIFKIVQYSLNVLWAYQGSDKADPDIVRNLKQIESHVALVRGGLRFGKFFDHFISALYTIHLPDPILHLTASLSQISFATHLVYDNLLWLHRIGLCNQIDEEKNRRLAHSYYLYSAILALIKNLCLLRMMIQKNNDDDETESNRAFDQTSSMNRKISIKNRSLSYENRIIYLEIVKNLCDILISMNALQKIRMKVFPVAVLGLLSSVTFILKKLLSPAT